MGLFDKLFKKNETVLEEVNASDDDICAIADGELIDVHTVSDAVFAEEMMDKLGGFVKSDSEALYQLCRNAAENIANELLLRSDM